MEATRKNKRESGSRQQSQCCGALALHQPPTPMLAEGLLSTMARHGFPSSDSGLEGTASLYLCRKMLTQTPEPRGGEHRRGQRVKETGGLFQLWHELSFFVYNSCK